jgi:hypothetical protein
VVFTATTFDVNGALTGGSVTWPDGTTGTYTALDIDDNFLDLVNSYSISYSTRLVTQPAITRDPSSGAVLARPVTTVTNV